MTWRYQMTHRTIKMPGGEVEDVFEVREVYDDQVRDLGLPRWTENAIAPDSDTKDGLIEVLQMMLRDVQEFGVLECDDSPVLDDGEPRQPCGHDRDADCRCTS